jgi:hypothetical protein
MKKTTGFRCMIWIFLIWGYIHGYGFGYGQGLEELAGKTADCILDYFKDKYNVKTSISEFENVSGISGLTAQKFYQLVVSKLETASTGAGTITYTDLMINFQQNKGVFNLNRIYLLNHLIYIKLTRNKAKIGAGVAIFSRTLDKIVYIKYLEAAFPAAEREIYDVDHYGFQGAGFAKIVEMNARRDLLDVKSFLNPGGVLRVLFYYPEKIEFLRLSGNRLDRFFTYKLQWKKPVYPVMREEGKLAVFFTDTGSEPGSGSLLTVTAGSNFAKFSKVLVFKNERWDETGTAGTADTDANVKEFDVNFVPFRRIELNNTPYLAGTPYAVGKNYFENTLILLPVSSFPADQPAEKAPDFLEKKVPLFYDLDFSTGEDGKTLNSIHMVDRDYKYRFLADNFTELTVEEDGRGASLACLDGHWLAVSDFSRGRDKLYFYKIEAGGRQLVFENKINGEIIFISDGVWKGTGGFWVCVKKTKLKTRPTIKQPQTLPADAGSSGYEGYDDEYAEYNLQFWSKKSSE